MCVRYVCCSLPTLGSTTLAASGAALLHPLSPAVFTRGCTQSSIPGFSYTVRTAAKGSDQLMSSACRATTTCGAVHTVLGIVHHNHECRA
eukprot:scaffold64301_cov53-Phaeocystis_antarctica.AAC.4